MGCGSGVQSGVEETGSLVLCGLGALPVGSSAPAAPAWAGGLPASYYFVETGSNPSSSCCSVCEYLGVITRPYLVLQIRFVLSYAHLGPPTLSYFYKQSP